MDLLILGILYKWKHNICDWLLSLRIMFSRFIMLSHIWVPHLFLIPLYGCITFCLAIHQSVDKHLACFYFLAIMNNAVEGLPWWRNGWESACRCGGRGFEPWSGGIPHAAKRLGRWATITEPARLEPVLRGRRGRDRERPAHRDEEWPPLAATGEGPRTETKTQHSHK